MNDLSYFLLAPPCLDQGVAKAFKFLEVPLLAYHGAQDKLVPIINTRSVTL